MRDWRYFHKIAALFRAAFLFISVLAIAAQAQAAELLWNLNVDGNYVVEIQQDHGTTRVFLRNSQGTWGTTNPNFIKALRNGLVVQVDGKNIVPTIGEGRPPASSSADIKINTAKITLYGHELVHFNAGNSGMVARDEFPLTSFDVRQFATYENYGKNFISVPKIDPKVGSHFKTDLHTHLAGHAPFSALMKIAYDHNIEYSVDLLNRIQVTYPKDKVVNGRIPFRDLLDSEEFKNPKNMARIEDAMTIERSHVRTFQDMEDRYVFRGPITKNSGAFKDMLWAVAEASAKSGVKYTEQSISNILDPAWLEVAQRELPEIEKATGVKIRFLAGLWRHSDEEWNRDEVTRVKRMVRASPYIVGVDFMGHETNSTQDISVPVKEAAELKSEFGPTFQVRVHAGENPLTPANVRIASELGATRVGHGLYIEKDPEALKADPHTLKIDPKVLGQLKKSETYIELNPLSNQSLNNLSGGHEIILSQFKQFKAAGIPVVLGSDGIGMYGADHLEIERVLMQMGFTEDDFKYVRQSEKRYLAEMKKTFDRRSKEIAASKEKIPTTKDLEAFVDEQGRHFTPELAKKKASALKKKLKQFADNFNDKGIQSYSEHEAEFKGMKAIDVSGGSKNQFRDLKKAGSLADLKIPQIRANFETLLNNVDPKKVFFITGGTQFGVEKILHEEIGKFNKLHPGNSFKVVGVLPEEANTKDVFGPKRSGITHYLLGGKTWSDFKKYKLDLLLQYGGSKIAIAGNMFVEDEFRSVINADLGIGVFYQKRTGGGE